MYKIAQAIKSNLLLSLSSLLLIIFGLFILTSISPWIFPNYLIFVGVAFLVFIFLLQIDFEIYYSFSKVFYIISIIALLLPLVAGQVTRGAVRWVPLGSITIQPSEIFRPFFLLYFARYITEKELNIKRMMIAFIIIFIPFLLILIQPSLGVAILTAVGFLGVLLASTINKKYFLFGIIIIMLLSPVMWFTLAPYQRQRLSSFTNPYLDPRGTGYNTIQSVISVGSGKIFGRGLGKGVQTQLAFLPERHNDFIFASISEELGFVGASLILLSFCLFFYRLALIVNKSINPTARAFVAGIFLILFAETFVHIGMNMGLLPITGVPLPLVSAGGSSLIGTVASLAIVINSKKRE